MLRLLQGDISRPDLEAQLHETLDAQTLSRLAQYIREKPLRYRNRALTVLAHFHSISSRAIARFLFLEPTTVRGYIRLFQEGGIEQLFDMSRKDIKKCEDPRYKEALFAILHAPPASYDINRTTWRMQDLRRVMAEQGLPLGDDNIRKIIRAAGYRFRKAKKVLTSTDPKYREKLEAITHILAHLGPKEKFFSIDEFGPFAVKTQGGTSLVPPGQNKTVPQCQKSRGSLIVTGALELSTNQVTHFYSEAKNTEEMIKLLLVLLEQYAEEDCIYFSWDAASWHASAKLYEEVERLNSPEYRRSHRGPVVKLAPLPKSAQFLNVIESVFSGMARAIIQNSDYQDVTAAKAAIDRYFAERNSYFKNHPKRAGNKIWGKERVEAKFRESNNCKDPCW
jgi:transposase